MKRNYTPEEVFWIFKEEHRLCSPLDPIADPTFDLKFDSTIFEWRDCRDLIGAAELLDVLNRQFRISISKLDWENVFNAYKEKTIGDVCTLISKHAIKEETEPIKIMGSECLSASIFLTLKNDLKSEGVDVSGLKPSSNISPYLKKNFPSTMVAFIMLGVRIFEKVEYKWSIYERNQKYIWDNFLPKYQITKAFDTGDVVTFRDLITKVIKE